MDWITNRKIEHVNLCSSNKIDPTQTYYSEGDGDQSGQWFLDRGTLTLSTLERWQSNFEEMSVALASVYELDAEVPKKIDGESALESGAVMLYKINPYYTTAPTYAFVPKVSRADCKDQEVRTNFIGYENVAAHYINEMLHLIWDSKIDISLYNLPNSADFLSYEDLNDLEEAVQIAYESLLQREPYLYRGTCGDSIKYLLNTRTGVLTLEGSGSTYDYSNAEEVPWYNESQYIKSIKIDGYLASIGSYLFCGLDITEFPNDYNTVTIGSHAFEGCTNLEYFDLEYVSSLGESAFRDCTSLIRLYLGKYITTISKNATIGCTSLKSVGLYSSESSYIVEEGNVPFTEATHYVGIQNNKSWDATDGLAGQLILFQLNFAKAQIYLYKQQGAGYTADFDDGWNTGSYIAGSAHIAPWWKESVYSNFMSYNEMTVIIPADINTIGTSVFLSILIKCIKLSKECTTVGLRNFPNTSSTGVGGVTSNAKVSYTGSESDKSLIVYGRDNDGLWDATWEYDYGG